MSIVKTGKPSEFSRPTKYIFIFIKIFIYFSKLGADVNGRRPSPVDILVSTVGW